jgi:hypothetical protein
MNTILELLRSVVKFIFEWRRLSYRGQPDPLVEVWKEADQDAKTPRRVAPEVDFQSGATPVDGAVDYGGMKWDAYSKVIETAEQFLFYCGRSLAIVIRKSSFKERQEILALRRVTHRRVPDSELLDD